MGCCNVHSPLVNNLSRIDTQVKKISVGDELSDEELEMAAGGTSLFLAAAFIVVAAGAAGALVGGAAVVVSVIGVGALVK